MGKLVNPADLKFAAARLDGSSPSTRTKQWAESISGIGNRLIIGRQRVRISLGPPNNLAFVQRIGQESSKLLMGVRFPHAGPNNNNYTKGDLCQEETL